ncbi:MAG: serine hydrolase [Salinivirgaceae bacterium]|nr:MAG: serine hydrolase [Salinivirgaceae bacterium]
MSHSRNYKIPEILLVVFTTILLYIVFTSDWEKRNNSPIETKFSHPEDTSWYVNLRNDLDNSLNNKSRFGFNGTILVGWDNKLIYEGYKGWANYKEKDSINKHTKFQIGSVSKQFTAVAILQLYAQGKLNLKDSISKFFPDLPYQGFTIHQLLVHRSGLSNYIYFIDRIVEDKSTTYTNNDIIRLWKEYKPIPYYPPGRRFDYSNSGYMLLASIIEKVSGMSYPEYMHKNIFEPLGMDDTFVYVAGKNDTVPNIAEGYKYHWKIVTEAYLNGTYGDKGIYSTAEDMFKWDQGLYSGKILNTDTLALAFEPMGKPAHFKHNYGYGWRIFSYNGQKVLYHAGWWQGFKSLLIRVPDEKLTIVILKNLKTGAMFSRNELLRLVLDNYLNTPIEAIVPDIPQFNQCHFPDPAA